MKNDKTMEKEKVFCKKCKYSKNKNYYADFHVFKDDCFYAVGVEYHGVLYNIKKKNTIDRNLNGTCTFYEKK